jgi:hypothetical protein
MNKSIKIKLTSIILIIATILLASCKPEVETTPSPSPTLTQEPISPSDEVYPPPSIATPFDYTKDEPYPAPDDLPLPTPQATLPLIQIPTPHEYLGVVTGRLVTPIGESLLPYLATLYLANTIPPDQEGYPPMIAFSEDTSPIAIQDNTGRFFIDQIEPGDYALVIWTPIASNVIMNQETEDYLVFTVYPGEITDLDNIIIP